MLSDEQQIPRIRAALERDAETHEPPASLRATVHRQVVAETEARSRLRRRRTSARDVFSALGVVVTLGVVALTLSLGGRHRVSLVRTTAAPGGLAPVTDKLPTGPPAGPSTADPTKFQGAAVPSTVRLVAEAPDPRGGLPWGLREFRTTRGRTCLQIGRVQDQTIGVIGQDNAWEGDHRFHPISPNAYTADHCVITRAHGETFDNVVIQGAIASADVPWGTGRQSGECRTGEQPAQFPPCPRADLRDVDYGLLGPEATRITYVGKTGELFTETTNGPDGAYLVVRSGSVRACSTEPGHGRSCTMGSGETSSSSLQSGVIVTVTYRDGHTCHLPAPTPGGVAPGRCPPMRRPAP